MVSLHCLKNTEVTHIKLKKLLKAFLNLMKNYPYGLFKFWRTMKKFTFNLGFSIIALKLKKDGLGLVILPGVQVNMLCTLKVTRKNNYSKDLL